MKEIKTNEIERIIYVGKNIIKFKINGFWYTSFLSKESQIVAEKELTDENNQEIVIEENSSTQKKKRTKAEDIEV